MTEPIRRTVTPKGPGWGELILPADTFDVDKHLWERVTSESPNHGSCAWDDAGEQMTFDVDYPYDYDATLTILGFAYVNYAAPIAGVGGYPMVRVNPLCHPRKPWLFASSVDSIAYYGPRGKELSVENTALYPTQPAFRAEYKVARFTVTFRPLPFDILEDNQIYRTYTVQNPGSPPSQVLAPDETMRYIIKKSTPTAEFITREGNANFKFVTPRKNGTYGDLPSLPVAVSESKVTYNWTWRYVPEEFVCATRGGPPNRWVTAMNCVNNAVFQGQSRWTFLHLPFTYERKRMPVASANGIPLYFLDIMTNWLYFEPGLLSQGDVDNDYHGHNTAPDSYDGWQYHFYTGPTGLNASNQPTGQGTADGAKRYQEAKFDKLFQYMA